MNGRVGPFQIGLLISRSLIRSCIYRNIVKDMYLEIILPKRRYSIRTSISRLKHVKTLCTLATRKRSSAKQSSIDYMSYVIEMDEPGNGQTKIVQVDQGGIVRTMANCIKHLPQKEIDKTNFYIKVKLSGHGSLRLLSFT